MQVKLDRSPFAYTIGIYESAQLDLHACLSLVAQTRESWCYHKCLPIEKIVDTTRIILLPYVLAYKTAALSHFATISEVKSNQLVFTQVEQLHNATLSGNQIKFAVSMSDILPFKPFY